MKKTLKTIVPLLMITVSLSSCTYGSVKPGPKENVVGTYELIKYEMNKVDENGVELTKEDGSYIRYDRKAEIGAVVYFSIADDGYSFYAYKDNSTSAKVTQMFTTFTLNGENEEHPEYVRSISMTDGVTHKYEDEKYVGCLAEPTMMFRDDLLKKILHYNLSGHMFLQPERKIPYQYVEYKRVSTEASLEKVNSLMGTNVSFTRPYELKLMTKYMVYHCSKNGDAEESKFGLYDYAFLDMDSYSNGNVKFYYKLKTAESGTSTNVPVTVTFAGRACSFSILGRTFNAGSEYSVYNPLPRAIEADYNSYNLETDKYVSENFQPYNGEANTIDAMISECLTNPNI